MQPQFRSQPKRREHLESSRVALQQPPRHDELCEQAGEVNTGGAHLLCRHPTCFRRGLLTATAVTSVRSWNPAPDRLERDKKRKGLDSYRANS